MDINEQMIYSEVYGILDMLGKSYIDKLPDGLYRMIKGKKLDTYSPVYDRESFKSKNIKREALSMIALFHLNYWCVNDEEKNSLQQMLNENEEKYQMTLKEKYNSDNLFKKKEKVEEYNNGSAIVQYKETIFSRFINRIKKVFH